MKHNWVPGHLAERHFAERHFAGRTFCRTDSLPKGELAENRDAISSKCLGLRHKWHIDIVYLTAVIILTLS